MSVNSAWGKEGLGLGTRLEEHLKTFQEHWEEKCNLFVFLTPNVMKWSNWECKFSKNLSGGHTPDLAGCKQWGPKQSAPVSVSPLKVPRSTLTYKWFIISLSVSIGLPSYPKIHHLNSCPGGTLLSLSMSDNAIMTAFYPGVTVIYVSPRNVCLRTYFTSDICSPNNYH